MSFFVKKSPRKSDVKAAAPKEKEEKKPLFRCVGSSNPIPCQQTNLAPEIVITPAQEDIDPLTVLLELKRKTREIKKMQRRPNASKKFRKLYLFMWDSLKKYNGVVCELVASRVKGRKPLQKEDCINYEVDSDEEYEEQVHNLKTFLRFIFRMPPIFQIQTMKKTSMMKMRTNLKMKMKNLLFQTDTFLKKKKWMKMEVLK